MVNNGKLAVILAGGLGTRLRKVVSNVPKSLAPIAGRPFLDWLLTALCRKGVDEVLLLLGYGAEKIMAFVGNGSKWGIKATYSIEDEPLDKAGALRNALSLISRPTFFFLNGDTLLDLNFDEMLSFHLSKKAKLTIAVRPWKDLSRVDPVKIDDEFKITTFGVKDVPSEDDGLWLVNGGLYVVEKDVVEGLPLKRLSWEATVIPDLVERGVVYAYVSNGYFIDIGVPDDYFRAQREIPEILRP